LIHAVGVPLAGWETFERRFGDRASGETIDQRLLAAEDEVLRLHRLNEDPVGVAYSAVLMGLRYAERGELTKAVPLFALGDRVFRFSELIAKHQTPLAAFQKLELTFPGIRSTLEAARRSLGEARFTTLWRAGSPGSFASGVEFLPRRSHDTGDVPSGAPPADTPRLLGRSGSPLQSSPRRVDTSHWSRLTEREREILRLVARGQTNGAIARDLGLSGRTVERHLANIYAKLRCHDRASAVARAYESGLL
jgi:DNA-binding CsgD family transcriptional regulator